MRRPLYSTMNPPFSIGSVANNPSPVGERPTREGLRAVFLRVPPPFPPFERARRAILSAHMRRLADDEFEAAPLALDELVELTDRRHLDLDEALRSLGRRLFRVGAVAALARIGDLFQRGKAIADFGHSMSPQTL